MHDLTTYGNARLQENAHKPIHPRAAAGRLIHQLRLWRRRMVTRRHLARLDARGLADIGITHWQACQEAEKPFWIA